MTYQLVTASSGKSLESQMNELADDGWKLIGEVKYNQLFWYVTMGKEEPKGSVGDGVESG